MVKRVLLFCALAGVSACDSPTGPRGPLVVRFDAVKVPPATEGVSVQAPGKGEIGVYGYLSTPCSGYQLSASATAATPEVILVVVKATPATSDVGCFTVVESYRYTAVLKNVSRGTYRVQVAYDVSGRRPDGPFSITEQEVEVR